MTWNDFLKMETLSPSSVCSKVIYFLSLLTSNSKESNNDSNPKSSVIIGFVVGYEMTKEINLLEKKIDIEFLFGFCIPLVFDTR